MPERLLQHLVKLNAAHSWYEIGSVPGRRQLCDGMTNFLVL